MPGGQHESNAAFRASDLKHDGQRSTLYAPLWNYFLYTSAPVELQK